MDASERRKRASSEAADWFARLQSGAMQRSEREQFVGWLRESHVHVTEMLHIAQVHGALEQFGNWARVSTGPKTGDDTIVQLPSTQDAEPLELIEKTRGARIRKGESLHRRRLMFLATAAAMVVLMIATALVLPRVRGQVIETERGERREVVLNDGSLLQVDPETRLRVKYSDEARRVFLEHGRTLFHVSKNPSRPFLVQANDITVRAVGTAFGVEEQTLGVIVTVAEGKVAVSSAGSQPLRPTVRGGSPKTEDSSKNGARRGEAERASGSNAIQEATGFPDNAQGGRGIVFLAADEQVMVPRHGAPEPVRGVDSRRALAWAEGRLTFENDPLERAIAEFNRYNHVQLVVTDPALARKPVSGVFNASDPEAFIAFLQSVTTVEIRRDTDRSIAIGRGSRP